jgi:hypothetical protein
MGLNPYDLFRTTYNGNGTSSSQKRNKVLLGEAKVGDEVKSYQKSVRLD